MRFGFRNISNYISYLGQNCPLSNNIYKILARVIFVLTNNGMEISE